MASITLLGIDLAKDVFQLHGLDELGRPQLKRTLRRRALVQFVAKLPACTIAMEACSSSHHFSRKFQQFGHEVKNHCNYSGTQLIDITCDFFEDLVIPEFLQT